MTITMKGLIQFKSTRVKDLPENWKEQIEDYAKSKREVLVMLKKKLLEKKTVEKTDKKIIIDNGVSNRKTTILEQQIINVEQDLAQADAILDYIQSKVDRYG